MVKIDVRLNEINKENLLKKGKISINIPQKELVNALIKENKQFKKANKEVLKYFSHIWWGYADFDKDDKIGVIYKKGRYDGTTLNKLSYSIICKENIHKFNIQDKYVYGSEAYRKENEKNKN